MEKRSWMMLPEVVTPESESQWYKHHHHQHHPTPSASLPQVVVTEEQDISPVSTASPVYSPQAARGQLFPPPMQTMRKKELLPEPKRKKEPMHTRSFIITVLVAWIVILAVGLGAGLGIGLQRPSTPAAAADAGPGGGGGGAAVMHGGNGSAAPIEVTRGTGLATVVRADGEGMLLYYQNAAGEVVEEFWTNSSLAEDLLSVSDANKAPVARGRSVVQTPEVVQGSVLAAVSFMLNGNVWRGLFYVDVNGQVRTTNSTALGGPWSSATVINGRYLAAGTPALAACYFPSVGIRVYLGNSDGGGSITKIENPFEASGQTAMWREDSTFQTTSSLGGAACTNTYTRKGQTVQDIYFRNASGLGNVVHFQENGTSTILVPEPNLANAEFSLTNDSAIAVAVNGNRTQSFLFWRGTDNNMRQANTLLSGSSVQVTTPTVLQVQSNQDHLTAVWIENGNQGPLVLYEDTPGNLRVDVVTWNGDVVGSGTLYGGGG